MKYSTYYLCIWLMLGIMFSAQAQQTTPKIDETSSKKQVYIGNQAYKKGDFTTAIKAYEDALSFHGNYYKAQYNLACATYHTEAYEQSRTYNERVISSLTASKLLKAKAHHNIGNSFLKEKKYQDAIQAYKQSLRLEPNSYNTKYNLAYAQKMLENQQDQQQDKQDQQDNQDQNQDQQDNQDQNQQNQDQQQDQNQDQNKNQQQNQNQQPDKPQAQQSKLSKEQAEAILNAMRQQEQALQEGKKKEKGIPVRMEKDW